MKLFKDEVKELYKMYFENMRVSEFEGLESVPDGVSTREMENLAKFIKNIKEANQEVDIINYKIGELIENFMVINYKEIENQKK